jgi:leucyl/phenylalanyl-tRNA--protein transferase
MKNFKHAKADFRGFLKVVNDERNPFSHHIFPPEFDELNNDAHLRLKRNFRAELKAKAKNISSIRRHHARKSQGPQFFFRLFDNRYSKIPKEISIKDLVDLKVERLLAAYQQGIFPWTANPITWWSPDPRGVIELDHFHVSESLARVIRKRTFEITIDCAFREVMQACAAPSPNRRSTWITEEFVEAYTRLHRQGHAHSVECWRKGELVGGIYGVSIGGLFAGESMFHRADNASKVALCHLVEHLREHRFWLFDIQMVTAATRLFGARTITRNEYLKRLVVAIPQDCTFS